MQWAIIKIHNVSIHYFNICLNPNQKKNQDQTINALKIHIVSLLRRFNQAEIIVSRYFN